MTTAPTPDVLERLAERVEKVSGPDRELDLTIHIALHPDGDIARVMGNRRGFDSKDGLAWDICGASVCYERYTDGRCWANGGYPLPTYSASLDAAMTLVPEGWSVKLYLHTDENSADLYRLGPYEDGDRPVEIGPIVSEAARTPALALTAACLRAKAAIAQELGR